MMAERWELGCEVGGRRSGTMRGSEAALRIEMSSQKEIREWGCCLGVGQGKKEGACGGGRDEDWRI
jgi:hypothetical protein